MFTGVIDYLGELVRQQGGEFTFRLPDSSVDRLEIGGSVAVNGSCSTVVEVGEAGAEFSVNLSPETLDRTTLRKVGVGGRVNIEFPLTATAVGSSLDGHFVQGHVDTVGQVSGVSRQSDSLIYRFSVPSEFQGYLVEKGAIAIDGISLTPYRVKGGSFVVSVIPHTYSKTTLQFRHPGSEVNVEFDLLAKYVAKQQ